MYKVAVRNAVGVSADLSLVNVLTSQDEFQILVGLTLLEVAAVAHAEAQHCGRTDLLDCFLGVEAGVVSLPRETNDDVVRRKVCEYLVVVDVLADQSGLDDRLRRVQIVLCDGGRVVVVRGAECYVYAAADINTPSDIVDASDDRGFVISVAGAYAQRGEKCKRDDQYGNNEENGFSYSFLQM